jgi:hypothetical protein
MQADDNESEEYEQRNPHYLDVAGIVHREGWCRQNKYDKHGDL